jgi:hypothetical protein
MNGFQKLKKNRKTFGEAFLMSLQFRIMFDKVLLKTFYVTKLPLTACYQESFFFFNNLKFLRSYAKFFFLTIESFCYYFYLFCFV